MTWPKLPSCICDFWWLDTHLHSSSMSTWRWRRETVTFSTSLQDFDSQLAQTVRDGFETSKTSLSGQTCAYRVTSVSQNIDQKMSNFRATPSGSGTW